MSNNKTLRIFMMPQEFPCGEQSSCCDPVGQSEQEIQGLRSGIENELGYEVEVFNVKNEDDVKGRPQIVQLLQSLGPAALPILTLDDEVVSMGNATAEKALVAIREKIEKQNFGKENKMTENDNSDEAGQENPVDSQACCSTASGGGDCCPPDSSSGGKSWKMLVFLVIVVAAGAVLAHSLLMKKSDSATEQEQNTFAAIQPQEKTGVSSPLTTTAEQTPADSKGTADSLSAANLRPKPLDSLASLSKFAPTIDAVFILLGTQDQLDAQPITSQIEAAAKKIRAGGIRISAFTLRENAPNYAQLAKQFPVPSVLAMVKGRGASGVSGEITEAKLIQAFVTASRPASGCGPSGCGPAGCAPSGPQ